MIPRGTPDLSWADLCFVLRACFSADDSQTANRIAACWDKSGGVLTCLSVRSALDLFLQAVKWPAGSEVLVSAITVPDMPRLLRLHGLVPVPIDLDRRTLFVNRDRVAPLLTKNTRAILLAHLFGRQQPLGELATWAHAHGLLILEDCAQAYDGIFRGDEAGDLRMFSFGPIKTATALGGAIAQVADRTVLARMFELQAAYPWQRRVSQLRRAVIMAVLKLLARPAAASLFVRCCRAVGIDYDSLVTRLLRGFPGRDLLGQIRRAPSTPLLQLLERRLLQSHTTAIDRRKSLAKRLLTQIDETQWVGEDTNDHSHWVLPIQSEVPEQLVCHLRRQGFDATQRASNLACVMPLADRTAAEPTCAQQVLSQILFLPTYPEITDSDLARLATAIRQFAPIQTTDSIMPRLSKVVPPAG